MAEFLSNVTAVGAVISDGIKYFAEPPLVYFVALSLAAAGIKIARGLIPRKKG